MKTESENHQTNQQCILPDYYVTKNPRLKDELCNLLENTELGNVESANVEQLKSYVQTEIGNNIVNNDEHSIRVRNLINQMLNK